MISISSPDIRAEDIEQVVEVLRSGSITQGQKVSEFEKEFAKYTGAKHAVAVNNGTSALQVALMAASLKKGEPVLTSPFSFIATGNSVILAGGEPKFCDIDINTYCLDPAKIQRSQKTRIIMPVHLYGHPANIKEIIEIANKNDQIIVWDAAQAHGAKFDGLPLGSFNHLSCFSFYATKNMTTAEGGMIITNDEGLAQSMRMIRNHGSERQYYHVMLGHNFRMTDINAGLGVSQLRRLDSNIEKRRQNAKLYNEIFSNFSAISIPRELKDCNHSYHQYTLRFDNSTLRDKIKDYLYSNGIDARVYYPIPIHLQPFYKNTYGYKGGEFPVAEYASQSVLSLPIHPRLTDEQIMFIGESVKRAFKECAS